MHPGYRIHDQKKCPQHLVTQKTETERIEREHENSEGPHGAVAGHETEIITLE